VARDIVDRVLGSRLRAWRARRDPAEAWERGAAEEMAFWREFLATRGGEWPEDYARRASAEAPVREPLITACMERLPGDTVSVLDVGAGPLTKIGTAHRGRELQVTAVDPLADEYDELLEQAGIEPRVRTRRASAEDLLQHFRRETFDIAYACNALDHAVDPGRSVANMFQVVVPGGFVVLRHFRNEAEVERYRGLHQWNLDERDGDLIAWRPGRIAQNLTGPLRDGARDLSCWRANPFVLCFIQKATTRPQW
jgi:SAM-dependent methyltransferase